MNRWYNLYLTIGVTDSLVDVAHNIHTKVKQCHVSLLEYSLISTLMLCLDINECENGELNMCSDVCINYDGGHSCQCPSGKSLSLNGEKCGGLWLDFDVVSLKCVPLCSVLV